MKDNGDGSYAVKYTVAGNREKAVRRCYIHKQGDYAGKTRVRKRVGAISCFLASFLSESLPALVYPFIRTPPPPPLPLFSSCLFFPDIAFQGTLHDRNAVHYGRKRRARHFLADEQAVEKESPLSGSLGSSYVSAKLCVC
jgi:hypothetical protein